MPKFPPPEPFDFVKPSEWAQWEKRFLRFRTATDLGDKDGDVQVSSLIYAMGSEAENIFSSFTFANPDDGEKDFDQVLTKFREHFLPKRNVIRERACFHQRSQRSGESVESFVRSLFELAEHCGFAASRDEQIRDRIVISISDKELSQKLQLKSTLTLDQALEMARQSEQIKAQVSDQTLGLTLTHWLPKRYPPSLLIHG